MSGLSRTRSLNYLFALTLLLTASATSIADAQTPDTGQEVPVPHQSGGEFSGLTDVPKADHDRSVSALIQRPVGSALTATTAPERKHLLLTLEATFIGLQALDTA